MILETRSLQLAGNAYHWLAGRGPSVLGEYTLYQTNPFRRVTEVKWILVDINKIAVFPWFSPHSHANYNYLQSPGKHEIKAN